MHDGGVALMDGACGKGIAQQALYFLVAGKDEQARGGHVQAVYDQRVRPVEHSAVDQAVLFVRATAGYGEQTCGFVQDEQVLILIEARRANCR